MATRQKSKSKEEIFINGVKEAVSLKELDTSIGVEVVVRFISPSLADARQEAQELVEAIDMEFFNHKQVSVTITSMAPL